MYCYLQSSFMCVVHVHRFILSKDLHIYVVIFVKDMWSRDRAIYGRAPKTVPKYFDLHILIYIEVEQNRDDYVK